MYLLGKVNASPLEYSFLRYADYLVAGIRSNDSPNKGRAKSGNCDCHEETCTGPMSSKESKISFLNDYLRVSIIKRTEILG